MADDEVRLRYSGFIMFLSRLFSVGTGLLFSLMVTRNVPAEEFGVYGNVTDILSYFTLAAGVFPFWATRSVARKNPGSSITGIAANLLVSFPFVIVYVFAHPAIMSAIQISTEYLVVYAIVTVEMLEIYLVVAFEATLRARRPQALGLGFLIFELFKVVLGFSLMMGLRLGLLGAIVSVIFAYFPRILFYLRLTLHEFREQIRWDYVKEWVKGSVLNIYGIIGQKLLALTNILLFVLSGELARAHYGAALTIANIVGYSSLLAFALYPRLLSEDRAEDVSVSFRMVLMFAIPMTIGAAILSDSFLIILNPIYRDSQLALVLLSLNSFCLTVSSVFHAVVSGTEKLDADTKIAYGDIARSRLFLLLTLPYVQAAVTVPLTYFVLTSIVGDAVEAAMSVALISLLANMILVMAKYGIAKRCLEFSIPWSHVGKYLGVSVIMALVLILVPIPTRVSTTVATTLLGGCIYFLLLSAIDEESRGIAKSATHELLRVLRIPSGKGPREE